MTITLSPLNTAVSASKTTGKFAPIAKLPSAPSTPSIMPDTSMPRNPQSATIKLTPTTRSLSLHQAGELVKTARPPIQPIKAPPISATPIDLTPIATIPIDEERSTEPVPMQPTVEGPGPYTTKTGTGGIIICNAPEME